MEKRQQQGVTSDELTSCEAQCAALENDWEQLRYLIEACRRPDADREKLESDFMALRSRLACDYPVLTAWRKGGYGLTAGINRMMAGSPTLGDLAASAAAPDSPTTQNWKDVQSALEKVTAALREARAVLEAGKEAHLPRELLQHDTHVPFPVRKVLTGVAVAVAIVFLAAGAYFLRHFLGVWAPGAGEGLAVTENMTDEQQIEIVLQTMSRAFEENSVDLFMTVIADDFVDEEGNGKRALRVALQAYKESGDFGAVAMDWSRMRITGLGAGLDVRPVYIITPDEEFAIHLGFRSYDGKWLVATGSAA